MNRLLFVLILLSFFCIIYAQDTEYDAYLRGKQQELVKYVDARQKAWADYRAKINKEYADKMSREWTASHVSTAVPVPSRPEPPKPVVKTNPVPTPTCSLSVKEFVSTGTYEMPQPVRPIAHPSNEATASYMFSFHSTPCKIHLRRDMGFTLSDISEKTVAEAWKTMSQSGFDVTADDCLGYREQLDLNDWGYVELTKTLSQHFCGEESNEAVLMQAYLLAQSGYKVRLARTDTKLVLLIPFVNEIYGYSYFSFDNEKYFLLDEKKEGGSYYIFNEKFEGEQTASLTLRKEPRFFDEHAYTRTFISRHYQDVSVVVSTNQNLIDFYNSYPITNDWSDYVHASLSRKVKRALYPMLKRKIKDLPELDATNVLLDFVQTAFEYQTDQEQFGYERPLFGDELFYYPYSDCEDRSILFSILVRDLLGLDVVMLNYPGHLATAVKFSEEVPGYYFMVKGEKYVVCDPTYIGASVGDCMPQFVDTSAVIVDIGD